MNEPLRERWRQLVESPYHTLQLFAVGALSFFAGLGALVFLDRSNSASMQSELLAVLSLLVLGIGFMLAIIAQVLFILQRLRR